MKLAEFNDRETDWTCAVDAIEHVLLSIKLRRHELDRWVSNFIVDACDALVRGAYPFAESLALGAMTPINERSPQANLPVELCSLVDLEKRFRWAQALPVIPYPLFGPIIFVDSARREGVIRN